MGEGTLTDRYTERQKQAIKDLQYLQIIGILQHIKLLMAIMLSTAYVHIKQIQSSIHMNMSHVFVQLMNLSPIFTLLLVMVSFPPAPENRSTVARYIVSAKCFTLFTS